MGNSRDNLRHQGRPREATWVFYAIGCSISNISYEGIIYISYEGIIYISSNEGIYLLLLRLLYNNMIIYFFNI